MVSHPSTTKQLELNEAEYQKHNKDTLSSTYKPKMCFGLAVKQMVLKNGSIEKKKIRDKRNIFALTR
jgi:hypothetical protein